MTLAAQTHSSPSPVATPTLPAELLQAASSLSGGKLSLVVGAGCSLEAPTSIPLARDCSREIHRRLLADGVLRSGDCSDPEDLSLVADAVYATTGSQRAVVQRFCESFDVKLAPPNDGHLAAAAMLCEGIIASVVTLNFDLALSTALSILGGGSLVGVIEGPDQLPNQKATNIYYLHRNANAADPEVWVLRSPTLSADWRGWQPIIVTRVLSSPVVVFVGLGTPIAVLVESARLMREAVPSGTQLYQIDPVDRDKSSYFSTLSIPASSYIQRGWCDFMAELSQRLAHEHIAHLESAITSKARTDGLSAEDLSTVLGSLRAGGLVRLGMMRSHWLLHGKPYCPFETNALGLLADLLLAVGMVCRVSGATASLLENGLVVFFRDRRAVAAYLLVSGRGHRGRPAVEAEVDDRRRRYQASSPAPRGVIVAGTSDPCAITVSPPRSIVEGNVSTGDLLAGPATFPMFHVSELRADTSKISEVVP